VSIGPAALIEAAAADDADSGPRGEAAIYIITDFQPFETTAATRVRHPETLSAAPVRLSNPGLSNPGPSNPSLSNPALSNPSLSNLALSHPGLSYPRPVNQGGMMMRHMLIAAAIAAGLVALWAALLPLAA
jgi:hypothetical protein